MGLVANGSIDGISAWRVPSFCAWQVRDEDSSKHFQNPYSVPHTEEQFTHRILSNDHAGLRGKLFSHFTDEDIEAVAGEITSSELHS